MLTGTELLAGIIFIVALVVMSIIDVAFAGVNKVSVRRLADLPKAKGVTALAARAEVLTSIHIVIQLILVAGAVLVFAAFERRKIRYAGSVIGTVVVMMFVILVFRQLIPRIFTMRSPEVVLL